MLMILLGLALAAVVGLSLGLLGGGGSILTVPIFVYVLGYDPKEAIAMSLAVVGVTSLFGAVGHWRSGNVNPRVALIFGSVAMMGTLLGARLAVYVSGAVQLVLFALVMLTASGFMVRDLRPATTATPDSDNAHSRIPVGHILLEGLGVGVLTGLVGVGGGFLVVPALILLGKVPMKQAVGTSLVVIAMNSAIGFAGYVDQVTIDWVLLMLFTTIAIGGILTGAYLVRYVPQRHLRRSFAVFLVMMGIFILSQNLEFG